MLTVNSVSVQVIKKRTHKGISCTGGICCAHILRRCACLTIFGYGICAFFAAGAYDNFAKFKQTFTASLNIVGSGDKFYLVVRELYNVGLWQKLPNCTFKHLGIVPQGQPHIRVKTYYCPTLGGNIYGSVMRLFHREISKRNRAEVQCKAIVKNFPGQIILTVKHIRRRVSVKRKFSVAVCLQADKCKSRICFVCEFDIFNTDVILFEFIGNFMTERVIAKLSNHLCFSAEFGKRSEDICRCTADFGRK